MCSWPYFVSTRWTKTTTMDLVQATLSHHDTQCFNTTPDSSALCLTCCFLIKYNCIIPMTTDTLIHSDFSKSLCFYCLIKLNRVYTYKCHETLLSPMFIPNFKFLFLITFLITILIYDVMLLIGTGLFQHWWK